MANVLEVKVRITKTELFMKLISLLNDVSTDKRVPAEVRDNISKKVDEIVMEVQKG